MPIDTNQQYCEIATAIIQKQIGILGKDVALKKVAAVRDIVANDEGEVITMYKPAQALESLVEQYKEVSGETAVQFCQNAAQPIITQYPNLTIPTILKSNTTSMENFLSSF